VPFPRLSAFIRNEYVKPLHYWDLEAQFGGAERSASEESCLP
jgi:hypothetical protein